MPDNFIANPGAGGATFASDDIGGVQYPRSKMGFGTDGSYVDVDAINRLPVVLANDQAPVAIRSADLAPVTGTLTALNGAVVAALDSADMVYFSVSGTYSQTLAIEFSDDNQTTWFPVEAVRVNSTALDQGTSGALVNTVRQWHAEVIGATHFRVRCSAFTSGTCAVRIVGSRRPIPIQMVVAQTTAANLNANVSGTVSIGNTANTTPILANPFTSQITAEASSAKVASGNSAAAITNPSATGVMLFLNASAVTGTTPSLVVRVQVQDPVSAAWVDLPGAAFSAVSAVTAVPLLLTVAPGVTAAANSAVNLPLPRTWRLAWVISGTTPSFTFSVGAQYIL